MIQKITISRLLLFASVTAILVTSCNKDELKIPKGADAPTVAGFSPIKGRVGQEVTITGSGFGTDAIAIGVYFNGSRVSAESVTDTEIKAIAPAGGVSGTLSISYFGTVVDSDEFTYLPAPEPSSIEPASGEPGDQVTIHGLNFGTVLSDIAVEFSDGLSATVISVTDTEIVVEVPDGGQSGLTSVTVGTQTVEGPGFVYPFIGIAEEFAEDNGGFETTTAGTNASIADGVMTVDFGGGNEATIKFDGQKLFNGALFPMLAVKMDRLAGLEVTLETDLGVYGGAANSYAGIIYGDVLHWDLSAGSQGQISSNDEISAVQFVEFKITKTAPVDEINIDFIRSFETAEKVKEYAALPVGKYIFEFDGIEDVDVGFTPQQNSTYVVEDSKLKVTFDPALFEGTGKRRADVNYSVRGVHSNGSTAKTWVYSEEYPIIAFKFTKPAGGGFKRNFAHGTSPNLGDSGANTWKAGSATDVYYWNNSDAGHGKWIDPANLGADGTTTFPTFTFKIADITSDELGYEIDWIRTFKSVTEMDAFSAE